MLEKFRANVLKLVCNSLLTKRLDVFLSRLNEINGGCEKILSVWGSCGRNLFSF